MACLATVEAGVGGEATTSLGGGQELHGLLTTQTHADQRRGRLLTKWRGMEPWRGGAGNTLSLSLSLIVIQLDGAVQHLGQILWASSRDQGFADRVIKPPTERAQQSRLVLPSVFGQSAELSHVVGHRMPPLTDHKQSVSGAMKIQKRRKTRSNRERKSFSGRESSWAPALD